MLILQQEFCAKLTDYWLDRDKELVFIDEASCSSWTKAGKVWMEADHPFYLSLAPKRGDGV